MVCGAVNELPLLSGTEGPIPSSLPGVPGRPSGQEASGVLLAVGAAVKHLLCLSGPDRVPEPAGLHLLSSLVTLVTLCHPLGPTDEGRC